MKIVVTPDKFKGSLTAHEVAEIVEWTMSVYSPQSKIIKIPMADGGEGSSAILSKYYKAEMIKILVHGPLRRRILAKYYLSTERKEAYIEMANASGSKLLNYSRLNGLITTTYGTGELIRDAVKKGAKSIILCIGGSATNDGGTGMANALGYTFLKKNGESFIPTGGTLSEIDKIIPPKKDWLKKIKVTVLADVNNPLYGPTGAAFQYGPQKGLDNEDCIKVDQGLKHLAKIIKKDFHFSIDQFPGSGAAGGLGGGASFFLKATMKAGATYIGNLLQLEHHIKTADLVISGEGKLDEQSLNCKVVEEVYCLCQRHKKPLLLLVGENELHNQEKYFYHTEIISLSAFAGSAEEALRKPKRVLKEALLHWLTEHRPVQEYVLQY
ncbi:glycerate kinase [Marivirga sp. S37H4]|uniref:Glycerate kinase n=1 Tax=Marivirga aurantiaca TaxID=2802615 RepID=A0A934X122_9BACT|nr:glycerate kinase [Marivirga aurantiaca]MBK6266988.1 glycerate kinase [Marivirga aurantiaca]